MSTTPYRTTRSAELLARGVRVDASLYRNPGLLAAELGALEAPSFASRAEGALVYDVDGHEYIDFLQAFGSVILGHACPVVDEAVIAELRRGVGRTLSSDTEIRLAELLVEVVPNADLILPVRTGSDATDAAVRLARAYTGRAMVLHWGYHGWHDWSAPRPAGIPDGAGRPLRSLRYNDLDDAAASVEQIGDELACIITMPYEIDEPDDGFLQGLCDLAHRVGALFVLDEVRSGFRLALGGAQQHFGVRADLVALSKAMGNGYAVAAVAGRADVMRCARDISVSSVYFRHAEAMAAAIATIETLRDTDALERVWSAGAAFKSGLGCAAERVGVPLRVLGLDPTPFVAFDTGSAERDAEAMRQFVREALRRGVLLHPTHHWFTSAAMSETVITQAVHALEDAMGAIAGSI